MLGLYLLRRKCVVFRTARGSEVIPAHQSLVPRTTAAPATNAVFRSHIARHLLPSADPEVVQVVVGHGVRRAAKRPSAAGAIELLNLGAKPGRSTDRVEGVTTVHRRPHLRDGPLARRGSRIVTGTSPCDVSRGTAVGLIRADHSKTSHAKAPEVRGPQIAIRSYLLHAKAPQITLASAGVRRRREIESEGPWCPMEEREVSGEGASSSVHPSAADRVSQDSARPRSAVARVDRGVRGEMRTAEQAVGPDSVAGHKQTSTSCGSRTAWRRTCPTRVSQRETPAEPQTRAELRSSRTGRTVARPRPRLHKGAPDPNLSRGLLRGEGLFPQLITDELMQHGNPPVGDRKAPSRSMVRRSGLAKKGSQ